ncbi:hypothetical protein J6590_027902 [Homalodisca vitripennis]|nr:hypothetical protein J6590_027902 [Homalodisca vitripennis]
MHLSIRADLIPTSGKPVGVASGRGQTQPSVYREADKIVTEGSRLSGRQLCGTAVQIEWVGQVLVRLRYTRLTPALTFTTPDLLLRARSQYT